MPKVRDETPDELKAFLFHGVDLQRESNSENWTAECPFCQSEGKFSVNEKSSVWKCWRTSCGRKGNAKTFLKQLWEVSYENTSSSDYEYLATLRGVSEESLVKWNFCRSIITGLWMIPAFNAEGVLNQLYVWKKIGTGKRVFMATAKQGAGLFLKKKPTKSKSAIWICEGVWDCIALEEAAEGFRFDSEGNCVPKPDGQTNVLSEVSIIGVPGCGVFPESWAKMCSGFDVVFFYDNDDDGYNGSLKAAQSLAAVGNDPSSILRFGWEKPDGGFNEQYPKGADVRDILSRTI